MSVFNGSVGDLAGYKKVGDGSFVFNGTLSIPAATITRVVAPPDASRLVVQMIEGTAVRFKRVKVGVWDGSNSGQLTAGQKGKLQLQFSPFGLTNSFAEYQGETFEVDANPATLGIDLTPEVGDFITLVNDLVKFEDYRDAVGLLTPGIGVQGYWQVRNGDGAAAHVVNLNLVAAWEVWFKTWP